MIRKSKINDDNKRSKGSLLLSLLDNWDLLLIVLVLSLASALKFFDNLDAKFEYAAILSGVSLIAIKLFRMEIKLSDQIDEKLSELTIHVDELEDRLGDSGLHIVEKCNKLKFYNNLQSAIAKANATVDLTNLDIYEPDHYGVQGMTSHFSTLYEVIKSRPNVQFRRVVTAKETGKVSWLIQSVVETQHCGNFSIRHVSLENAPAQMISLQIVDDAETLIVDPATGSMVIGKQDDLLWIRGNSVASSLSRYYEENWKRATIVKEGKKVNVKFLNELVDACASGLDESDERIKEMRTELDQIKKEFYLS